MNTISIDIETYSEIDIKKSGAYKYIEHPTFEILLFAYSINGGLVNCVDLARGEKLPDEVYATLDNPEWLKTAWNASGFEHPAICRRLKLTPIEQWECTMSVAAHLGYPLSLDAAAKIMGLPVEKDPKGKALIRYFTQPCKPTKTNGGRTRNLPEHDPEKWEQFKAYNIRDVEVELAAREKCRPYSLSASERRVFALDSAINSRGILIDRELVDAAIRLNSAYSDELLQEAKEITGLDNPNSVAQLKAWLEQEGEYVTRLNKETIPELLAGAPPEHVGRVLELRQGLSKSSIKKYQAMVNAVCMDGRVRGIHQYYGANRTGRFAGRLIQPQNLPGSSFKNLAYARELVKSGDTEILEALYDGVPKMLSQLIRTAIIPAPGHRFIVFDFSAIESRVLAWLAGEEWKLDVFRGDGKVYEAVASRMFGVPIEKIDKKSPYRAKGKIGELACIAENELVLTDSGLIPIQDIQLTHKLWDGTDWVNHGGVIFKGEKETIKYDGLRATENHIVWVEGKYDPIRFGDAAARGQNLVQSGAGEQAIRVCKNNKSRAKIFRKLDKTLRICSMHLVWAKKLDILSQSDKRKNKRMSEMFAAKADTTVVRSKINGGKTALRKSKRQRIQKLWRAGNTVQVYGCNRGRAMDNPESRVARQKYGNRQKRKLGTLRTRKYKIRYASKKQLKQTKYGASRMASRGLAVFIQRSYPQASAGQKQRRNISRRKNGYLAEKKELERHTRKARVYDILNSGPRNRFTVSGKLVHNCGFGGSVPALIRMGALKDENVREEDLPGIVKGWRSACKKTVQYWYALQDAAVDSVYNGKEISLRNVKFGVEDGIFKITLPSSRKLSYIRPKLAKRFTEYGERIMLSYEGMDQVTKQWGRRDLYYGLICENIVQATARDLLASAMLRLEKAGYKIVMHVHDEVVLEVPEGFGSMEEVHKIMTEVPAWAAGLPLAAEGEELEFYRK